MSDQDHLLKIIDKCIDAVSSINQNLGPVKDTLIQIVSKSERQLVNQERLEKQIQEIFSKMDFLSDQFKELIKINDAHNELEIKKLESDTQFKITEITQSNTTIRENSSKIWSFWGIAVPAILTAIVGILTLLLKNNKEEKKPTEKIIERVIEKR